MGGHKEGTVSLRANCIFSDHNIWLWIMFISSGCRGKVVSGEINSTEMIWILTIIELGKSSKEQSNKIIVFINDYENCQRIPQKKYFNWTWTLLDFVLFLCQYFFHNLVKYCSIFKNFLDNFQQLTEWAI